MSASFPRSPRFGIAWIPLVLFSGLALAPVGESGGHLSLFPERPCQDGWAGCIVDGQVVDAEVVRDRNRIPQASDRRIGWFDLQPTAVLSPFSGLSAYTGVAPVTMAEKEAADEQLAAITEERGEGGERGYDGVAEVDPEKDVFQGFGGSGGFTGSVVRPDPVPDPVERGSSGTSTAMYSSLDEGGGGGTPNWGDRGSESTNEEREPEVQGGVAESSGGVGSSLDAADQGPESRVLPEDEPVVADAEPEPEPAPPEPTFDDSCSNLRLLEPQALVGRLRTGQVGCLEERIATTSSQTGRGDISLVLMNNAEASRNMGEWERLVRRHLEEIDRSDPDICFKYARHLSLSGSVSRSYGVIKWAEYALENKSNWTGNTFKTRVYALYQMRAQAASRIWEQAKRDLINASSNRDELATKEEQARGRAKTFAREWLDYARASGQPTSVPMELCSTAAGTREYCQD